MNDLIFSRIARMGLATAVLVGCMALGFQSAAAQSSGSVYDLADLDSAPQLMDLERTVDRIRRAYPANLRSAGVGGRVQVEAVVGEDGRVESGTVKVVHADHAGLSDAALSVVPDLRFAAGRKGGATVRSRVIIPIAFQP